ncbi:MAG TPA: pilus assembly protein PilM [Candidatus Binatia bacterium]|jgi:type IV pilus assembly protein PilM|nr:pilus assembly protein PilM [Candidatus Binatia bacterium]
MALPFINGNAKKRDQMVSIDLGGRTTKAVYMQRNGEGYVLSRYALLDAPIYEKNLSTDLLAEHLRSVCQALEAKTRNVTLALGVNESIVRHAELPLMPISDMRQVLKNNTKNYLQQDLPGHVFDCFVMQSRSPQKPAEKPKLGTGSPKQRVLVAGAKRQLVDDLQTAIKSTGLLADHIVPGLLGPVNTFELAMPEIFSREVVALVDIGFKSTSICLLQEGELVLSRVVGIGGDRLTNGLAESLNISYAEAEGIKVGMPTEVQTNLEALVLPLGRELRASIDFFEHQQDKAVSQVFVSGGSARSDFIVQTLQTELMAECKPWNPLSFLEVSLPPQQTAEIDHVAPQLAVAVGAAVATF